ncbi:hypothetical protein TVAG_079640 [Trichomonas vaginalis G3]|uniref:Uncharacterized protein n=1 Tax=Trichomonas vaginalis (strain ATCC PRA-98 / G3) TaxID=412133 RepID=A2EF94_TRIV3|nr:hypothetical protein TVAGG3_1030520 [Trichomonas vaginalis G3]EAY08704.1 hypothetical protein TVAG_079640 [Trichomonas vaginalis G3]KAI5492831.1 hypothetical protein TVAGG3_1030520 [Trichomonas vaginalis G3]|eukprot:XP_001320927.1 hypothetical protein [Trichomonas vaginalis G3]
MEEEHTCKSTMVIVDMEVLPLLTNISILLFLIFSIDLYRANDYINNVLAYCTVIFWYISGLVQFIAYGRVTGGWDDLFGASGFAILIIIIVITYPIFYLFWLPIVLYHLVMLIGCPWQLWQRRFQNGCMTLDKLIPSLADSTASLVLCYIYIGIPFWFFCVIYIGSIIILSPVFYFLFSPMGYSTFGIVLHVSLRFPTTLEFDIKERVEKTYRFGVFFHVYLTCLPMVIISAVSVALNGVTWWAILMLVLAGLNFLVDCVTSIINLAKRDDMF